MQNKLKKKQRSTSTPVLSLSSTPRLQEKVDLPAGVQQIGLGIGYTYTRPPGGTSTPMPVVRDEGSDKAGEELASTRRAVSTVGTVSAIQRCSAIFANLALGKANGRTPGKTSAHTQAQAHAVTGASVERASEESDALEAVMREMYGASWSVDSGCYGGGASGVGSMTVAASGTSAQKHPGRVYSVPGMTGLTGTIARNTQAGSSTLRLVDPVPGTKV